VVRARALALLGLLAWSTTATSAQTLGMSVSGDAVRIRAPGWSFLDGEPLARLKDGRTVRVEVVATALAAPGRTPITAVRQIFSLSYDLWEERFAVAVAGARAASISHLTAAAAEAWCVEQMAIPIASLGSANESRFWIRLDGRMLDGEGTPESDESEGLTLQRIIDALSRRKKHESPAWSIDGGPFRLPSR
jgi:hypothetical protein